LVEHEWIHNISTGDNQVMPADVDWIQLLFLGASDGILLKIMNIRFLE
jgi:hypothetical protein